MQRVELPTQAGLHKITLKKMRRRDAILTTADGEDFTLPLDLLPAGVLEGEVLSLKILDGSTVETSHEIFARRLLTELIN